VTSAMKQQPSKKFSEHYLSPIRAGLRAGITGQMLADEYLKITGQKIAKSVVYRWLCNKGDPVEPLLGSGLALKAAFERLNGSRNGKSSHSPTTRTQN